MTGMHAVVEQRHEQLDQLVADAAQSFGKDIGAQQQHGADLGLFQRFPHAAGVAAHQVALQLLQVSGPMRTSDNLPKPVLMP